MLVWWVRDKPDIRHRGGLAIYYGLDHYYATPIVNVTIHSPHVSWLTAEIRDIVPFFSCTFYTELYSSVSDNLRV